MNEYLKGNYKVDVTIEEETAAADSTDEFERKALSRLGGSICFVSKKKLLWNGEPQPEARRADTRMQSERSESGEAEADKKGEGAHGAGAKNR
jgi:hypothetical protein